MQDIKSEEYVICPCCEAWLEGAINADGEPAENVSK